ncbi:hypothetical protein [Rhizobium ruizarguesonis]|uniref:hypothetical protein n=1 Tax=Rhizobium ruizarguesonis TaxID=2081791 RepID=UPI001032207C|nr:hypothetical protein [Rhizobium ruizarguesonis]TBE02339.1 hypothetical protein ELH10_15720 [Rhizobium ruizarguesonis]TBF14721.1 hypothetical protein ELG95_14890 [Rhizobium ruizarguesonis]
MSVEDDWVQRQLAVAELGVSARLEAMLARYTEWVETGVPTGVDFKKTLSAAHNWSCPEYGIFAVASKRDWNTKSKDHGKIVAQIGRLLKQLRPFDEVQREKRAAATTVKRGKKPVRTYTTQKARRVAAEDEADILKGMLEATTKKYHQLSHKMGRMEIDLATQKVRNDELERRSEALEAENARWKRMLTSKSGGLNVVE